MNDWVKNNPMRRLVRQQCPDCRYYWQAPVHHACPKCHCPKERIQVMDETHTEAARV